MGKCDAIYKEIRFVIEEELTHAYVSIEAAGDCPLGVQGWHHRAFPASSSALDILNWIAAGEDPILWAQEAP